MASKRATYKVEFSFNGLTLAEQDQLYNKLISILDFSLKDKLNLKVTDLIGGTHDPLAGTGVRPDNVECAKCGYVDCALCKVWKKVEAMNKDKENTNE